MSRAVSLLLESVRNQEEQARLRYQKSLADLEICRKNLDAINDYREIYSGELNDAGKGIMKTSTLTQFNSFISRLDTAAADQAASLRQAEAFVERCREDYQALQTRRKGLEKLLEKEAEEIRAAAAKAEQKLMDESALHSHMRRQRQEGL